MNRRPSTRFLRDLRAFVAQNFRVVSYTVYCKDHGVILFSKVCGHNSPPSIINGWEIYPSNSYREIQFRNPICCSRVFLTIITQ